MNSTVFIITATIGFFILGLVWGRRDWFNFTIKFIFLGIAIWGLLISLNQLGYVVRP